VARALPIVGRVVEREALSAACTRASAGRSQVLLITGPAGIGKTRLVEDLCAQARAGTAPAQVLIGESAPLVGATLAYGPFVAALRDHAEWLLDDGGTGDMLTQRHRLFLRVLGVLSGLAAEAPLLLVLEDLHWADRSSRELLTFLAVRLQDQPVMVVATIREDELENEARRWLTELERCPHVTRLRLAGLADDEIAELITDFMSGSVSADQVAAVVTAADGNPLYARELAGAGPAGLPASITDAVVARASGITPSVRELVDQVSVADSGVSHELLAATIPLPETALLSAVRAAIDSGLLVPIGDGYAFQHTLIRQVIYAQLIPGERRRLHRRFAEVLAELPCPDSGQLAQHWYLAGCPDRAAPSAVIAARKAVLAHAYPEASRNFGLAIELARWLPEYGPDLLEEAARAASWAGETDNAIMWIADALAQSGPPALGDRARRLERLGRYRWEAGDPRAAVEATEQAMALLDAEPASMLQARVLAALATRRMMIGESGAALPLAVRAVAVAQQTGADAEHAHGLATLGTLRAQQGDLGAGIAALRTAFTLAHRSGSVEDLVRAAASHTYLLYTAGRFAEAIEVARNGRRALQALNAPPTLTSVLDNNAAGVLLATGQWEEADQLITEVVQESAPNFTQYLRLLQLELAVGRGESERAAELAAALRKSPDDPRLIGPLRACLAEQALNANDLAVAAAEVMDGLATLNGTTLAEEEIRLLAAGARVSADLALLPLLARPRNVADEWEPLAATFTDRARAIIDQRGGGQPELSAFAALVAAENARQHRTATRAVWRTVAEAWQAAGQPYRQAYARLREAEAAVRAGQRDRAARALAACESLASRLPAPALLTMAADLAHRARLSDRPGSPGGSDPAGSQFGLTDREIEVLAHLARGDSNGQIARALFISDRTVAVHVSRILGKLGVRNRTEAATAGARLGLMP
jgi:DNA-binding CsgD family transcriptional regulator/tetratricopeptide (TPR) repeat protein